MKRFYKQIKELIYWSQLKKSNWGRDFGWYVEYEGQKVGELIDSEFEDMFWFRYKIISYEGTKDIILNYKLWEQCNFKFLNKHYSQYAENAFYGGEIYKENGYDMILMRGLSIKNIGS